MEGSRRRERWREGGRKGREGGRRGWVRRCHMMGGRTHSLDTDHCKVP